MKPYQITFRSVTYAQRGERLLHRAGYRPLLLRTPRWMEERGCGYCLKIRTGEIRKVLQILEEARLPVGKVYHREQEQWQEVAL